jgi:hypothetical protein
MTLLDESTPTETQPAALTTEASSRRTTDARRVWRGTRVPLLLLLLVVAVGVVAHLVTQTSDAALDPTAAGPRGGRAVAQLLAARGVSVDRTTRPRAADGTTTLVLLPELVSPETLGGLTGGRDRDVVVVGSLDPGRLRALGIPVSAAGGSEVRDRDPDCTLPEALAAGRARLGGAAYTVTGGQTDACYASDGAASLVVARSGSNRVVLLGSGELLTNERLDEQGNAALALRLLGRHDALIWTLPTVAERVASDEGRSSVLDLLPRRVRVALLQILVVALLVALWRMRRLGPVVAEGLPAVVRAVEAVAGRGRLYAVARARTAAAAGLRRGTLQRLQRVLGLPRDATLEVIADATATRSGTTPETVRALLYGPAPADDPELARLAAGLQSLEREVLGT